MEETTYLEDFLQSAELLPNDVRRDFELMREHDRECSDLINTISINENKLFQHFKQIKLSTDDQKSTSYVDNNNESNLTETPVAKHKEIDTTELVAEYEEIKFLRNRLQHRALQKVSLATNMLADLEKFINKLDNDLSYFEVDLRGCGEFDQLTRGIEPGTEVAIKVAQSHSSEIILGRVIFYHSDMGMYDIADIDDSKRYHVSQRQIAELDLVYSIKKLSRGEEVLAVYPDTTSFYPAQVTQAAKRNMHSAEPSVTVQFVGDFNDQGEVPHIIVPLNHVIRYPDEWK